MVTSTIRSITDSDTVLSSVSASCYVNCLFILHQLIAYCFLFPCVTDSTHTAYSYIHSYSYIQQQSNSQPMPRCTTCHINLIDRGCSRFLCQSCCHSFEFVPDGCVTHDRFRPTSSLPRTYRDLISMSQQLPSPPANNNPVSPSFSNSANVDSSSSSSSSNGNARDANAAVDMAQFSTQMLAFQRQLEVMQAQMTRLASFAASGAAPNLRPPPLPVQPVSVQPASNPVHSSAPLPQSDLRRRQALGVNSDELNAAGNFIQEILASSQNEVNDPHAYQFSSAIASNPIDQLSPALSHSPPGGQSIRLESVISSAIAEASKVHKTFKTFREFSEALELNYRSTRQLSNITMDQLEKLRAYNSFIFTLCGEHGFQVAQNYHFSVAKFISAGEHSIYRDGSFHPQSFAEQVTAAVILAASSKIKKPASRLRPTQKDKAKFPVGSCKNHPSSTTHNTDGCFAAKKTTQ